MKPQPDTESWFELIKNIKPSIKPEFIKKDVILKEVTPTFDYSFVYSNSNLDDLEHGTTDNIDKNTARKFKKGDFRIERRLDLHGYTEKKAYEAVLSFVRQSYQQELRCVLIVTGKGLNKDTSEDLFMSKGILKEKVPQWLNNEELRPLILSYSYATQKDGGSGALYVLIKRKR